MIDGIPVYETGREAVYDICCEIIDGGGESSPRGQTTKELLGTAFRVDHSWDVLPSRIGREKLLPAIAAAELLQNVAGVAAPELMHRISKFFPKPTSRWDAGIPTYGERIGPQLEYLVAKLREDPDSRQAVATVLEPGDPASGQMHNLCAIALQFMVRDGALVTFAHMRSNDAWYGLCYDMFMFAGVGLSIANSLDVGYGPYFHTANSMHLYERHFEAAGRLHSPPTVYGEEFFGIGRKGESWAAIKQRALFLLEGRKVGDMTPSEAWLDEQLDPYQDEA